jgi:hypothetical protein
MRYLREAGMTCIQVESDNSTTVSNLAKQRGAPSMVRIMRRIFSELAKYNMEVMPKHRPGKLNQVADALSRLERAGDYSLKRTVFTKGVETLLTQEEEPEDLLDIDLFATRSNNLLERYVSPTPDEHAVACDAFSITWEGLKPLVHPPIILLTRCLQRITRENVRATIIAPKWPSQPWWPLLMNIAKKSTTLGRSEDILLPGRSMLNQDSKLPPGELIMVRSW